MSRKITAKKRKHVDISSDHNQRKITEFPMTPAKKQKISNISIQQSQQHQQRLLFDNNHNHNLSQNHSIDQSEEDDEDVDIGRRINNNNNKVIIQSSEQGISNVIQLVEKSKCTTKCASYTI